MNKKIEALRQLENLFKDLGVEVVDVTPKDGKKEYLRKSKKAKGRQE
jgi:nitrogenase molybdenum-iron protein alpha/beta subunit